MKGVYHGSRRVRQRELYYPGVCRTIAATDYDGYVGQVFTPKGDQLAGLERAYRVRDV